MEVSGKAGREDLGVVGGHLAFVERNADHGLVFSEAIEEEDESCPREGGFFKHQMSDGERIVLEYYSEHVNHHS
jgi:hypothetical protein